MGAGAPKELPPPRYIARWGKVSEEIEVSDSAEGEPPDSAAIRWAEGCSPPPETVIKVETLNAAGGSREREAVIFRFFAYDQPPMADGGLTLDEAIDAFFRLAFPGGIDEVAWRGPKGINQAIQDLKAAYYRERGGWPDGR